MAKIIVNMGTKSGRHNITAIADADTMKKAISEIKEAIKALDGLELEDGVYKVARVEK